MTIKTFVHWATITMSCIVCFLAGIMVTVLEYQTAYAACVNMVAPFTCTTDMECIIEEEQRWERLKRSF